GLALALILMSGATFAYAAPGGEGPGHGPGGGGPRGGMMGGGEVTAVDDDSLTVENLNGEEITVNVSDDTVIHIVETGEEGSLDDIDVGDNVRVRGPRNEDGDEIDAMDIAVMPDGDHVMGRVTAVDDDTITVENPDGTITINVSDDTIFRNGQESASLSDVTEGSHITAFGDLNDDELDADLVMLGRGRGPKDGPPQGDEGQGPPPNGGGQGQRPGPRPAAPADEE
ncbi:MAG: hypothetical protein KDJ52_29155, partial [Anaerolineae bacterium]|nr:hypothetical protein [Anaerolineae bacterium]